MQEEYYPRGGIRRKPTNADNTKKSENLFNTFNQRSGKGKPKRKTILHENEETSTSSLRLTSADVLTYDKIVPGMVALGCIRNISTYAIQLELPGRIFAQVKINSISDVLTKELLKLSKNTDGSADVALNTLLSQMFDLRQFIPVFVCNVEKAEGSSTIIGSVDVKEINDKLTYDSFEKGALVWGCIIEKSEHVYVVDLGVKNTRATLPFNNCENKDYVIGTPLWLIVKSCTVQDKVTTLTMNIKKRKAHPNIQPDCTLNEIIPGMCVKFNVTKALKDGLEGVFFDGFVGYINEVYLTTPMESFRKYEGTTVNAYVLYIHPTTNITYFTMRPLEISPEEILSKGYTCKAKIVRSIGRGVIVKLNDDNIGIVTSKRLVRTLGKEPTTDLTEAVKSKFRINSVHDCVVLDYFYMDMMYICSFEKNELKQSIFDISNLSVGQLVKGTVHEIVEKGITVRIGKLIGFASNEHLSKTAYSDNIKKNFRIGDTVLARVWEIQEKSAKLTFKQPFIDDDKCLTSYKMAKSNEEYKGMVVKHYDDAVLIRFYGGVKGLLKSSQTQVNYKNMYYIGEVITVTVLSKSGEKLLLTTDPPVTVNVKKLHVGDVVDGVVESTDDKGLFVNTKDNNRCFLPRNSLSIDAKLAQAILGLYKPGDTIENLICMQDKNTKFLSRCEFAYYTTGMYNILKLNELEPGTLVRASIKTQEKSKLLLRCPTIDAKKSVILTVDREDVVDEKDWNADFQLNEWQPVIAKIKKVLKNGTIRASIKLEEVFSYDFENSIQLLKNYLSDVEFMNQRLSIENDPLTKYKIGDHVSCRIVKINNIGCCVELNDGVKGIVDTRLWPNKPLIDSVHTGIVLHVNYVDKYLEISLNNKINGKISKKQGNISNIVIGQIIHAKMLLIRREFALCTLGQTGNRQIAYMPIRLHENDFVPNRNYYKNLKNIKFVVHLIVNEKIIGIEKNMKKSLEKNKKKRSFNFDEDDVRDVKKRRLSTDQNNTNGFKIYYISDNIAEINEDEIMDLSEDISKNQGNDGESEVTEEEDENEENDQDDNGNLEEENSEEEEKEDDEMNGRVSNDETSDTSEDDSDTSGDDSDTSEENNPHSKINGETMTTTTNGRMSFSEAGEEFTFRYSDNASSSHSTFNPSSINSFFDSDDEKKADADSEDETVEKQEKPKNKNLTRSEQIEMIKRQEEELRKKELKFADSTSDPESATQFDRRLLAEPNNSEMWTKYVSFHLAATEIEKARGVIKRALETISHTAEQDRLNIWIASLNLENSYGTKDSFLDVFNEAVRRNDDFKVYMNAINILSSSSSDLVDDIIKRARGKFKNVPKMYLEIGRVYYNLDRMADARNLKDMALQILEKKSDHTYIAVQFGIMEFNYGEEHHAEALFETILQSYAHKIDVWFTYVDQLIKKGKIDSARRVLERAVAQNLKLRKMKALHKKFRDFEDKYGNDETRAEQRRILSNYAKKFGELTV